MSSNNETRGDDQVDRPFENWDEQTQCSSPTPQSPSFFDQTNAIDDGVELAASAKVFDVKNLPIEFARYTLIELVGEGGAGLVFKAKPDPGHEVAKGHNVVAVKLIRPEIMASPKAAKRFEKESRLHAEVDSPYVTKHLEFGCEQGVHFIASEFVAGVGLDEIIEQLETLPVENSLRIATDLLQALTALHENDVIHRDVKPGNVIASLRGFELSTEKPSIEDYEIGKLTDFGLARHIEQSESLAMTRQQTLLGTPLYMAPEQYYESRSVDARADIYSVGVTLYQMLAGCPPFEADEAMTLAEMHRVERPRPLTFVREGISEAVNSIVMKALEKEPALRYQNAFEMLADVQRVLDGTPTSLRLYPETPDASDPSVRRYKFEWNLDATTKQLWPLVSDTDRFNQAIGLPAPRFSYDHSGGERKIFAEASFNGMKVRWQEHPFQWIVEREMSVLREFDAGPFKWVTSTVELHPLAGNRTRLIHRFQVKPRGWFGKMMTPIQFNVMTKRSLNRVYNQLEKIATDTSCGYACDVAFLQPVRLNSKQNRILSRRVEELASAVSNRNLAKEFANFLGSVADPLAARIRPIPLSQKLSCSLDESLQLCLRGVEVGLLNMSWDVICPVCRIAAGNVSSLSRIKGHGNCDVCNLEFEIDFSKSVEVIFSAHPEIRLIELKTYCIGGPYHAPHVLAQNRLLANQYVDVGTAFAPGKYKICGPQLTQQPEVSILESAISSRAEFFIGASVPSTLPDLQPGASCIHVENQSDVEVLFRLEQSSERVDSLTAATASHHPLFQKLFPQEVVEPEELVDLSSVYLLAIKHLNMDALIDKVGEIQVRDYWTRLQKQFPTESADCEVVECMHDSVLVSFGVLEALLESLSSVLSAEDSFGIPIAECCFAINSGEIMIGSQANQPVAFGKTVRATKQMLADVTDSSIVLPFGLYDMISASDSAPSKSLPREFVRTEKDASTTLVHLVRGEN
ncbi:MAG: protein kinase [Mariniblastus sp.]